MGRVVRGGMVCKVIFMSNPTIVLRLWLCCVVTISKDYDDDCVCYVELLQVQYILQQLLNHLQVEF